MIEDIIIGIIGILIFSFFAIIFTSLFDPELRRGNFSKQIFKKTATLSLAMIFLLDSFLYNTEDSLVNYT